MKKTIAAVTLAAAAVTTPADAHAGYMWMDDAVAWLQGFIWERRI